MYKLSKNTNKILFYLSIFLISVLVILILLYFGNDYYIENKLNKARNQMKKLRENKDIGDKIKTFPKYYINLKKHKKRRNVLNEEFSKYDLKNNVIIEGFDGKKIKDMKKGTIDGYNYENKNDEESYEAQLAISMSHLKAIKQAKNDNHKMAMIMEDDIRFTLVPYWKKNFEQILKEIPEDCEILLLANRRDIKVEKMELLEAVRRDYNGVCYIVTEKGMNKISKFFDGKSFKFDLENIVFDQGVMTEFKTYTYNLTLFLLDNYEFGSSHSPFENGPIKVIPNTETMTVLNEVY